MISLLRPRPILAISTRTSLILPSKSACNHIKSAFVAGITVQSPCAARVPTDTASSLQGLFAFSPRTFPPKAYAPPPPEGSKETLWWNEVRPGARPSGGGLPVLGSGRPRFPLHREENPTGTVVRPGGTILQSDFSFLFETSHPPIGGLPRHSHRFSGLGYRPTQGSDPPTTCVRTASTLPYSIPLRASCDSRILLTHKSNQEALTHPSILSTTSIGAHHRPL